MSTTVIFNLPEHGHMNATYPVVSELVRRGERVIYYATEPYRKRVEQTGAEYVSYGPAEQFFPPAHTGGLYSVMAYSLGLAERILPDLLARLAEQKPDYLLIDSLCVWGSLVRQISNLPAAMLGSVFVPNERLISAEDLARQAYDGASKETLLAGIQALDTYLQAAQRIDRKYRTQCPNIVEFFANRQALNVVFTSREFHLMGARYDDSYKFTGPSIPPINVSSDFSGDGAPLIYISMGTIFNDLPRFYRCCFAALAGEPYQVVLATGGKVDRQALGDAPANFFVCERAPQLEVLQHASAFLTHGGMNSVNEALWHEVPLVVFPQHGDQRLVAERVAELGAGVVLGANDISPDRIRDIVRFVLSQPGFKEQARQIAATFRAAGGYRRAADEILKWRS